MDETFNLLRNSRKVRILLIAPNTPGLSWDREIATITSLVPATVLTGNVTTRQIGEAILREHYDILHFVAHACADGIELSNEIMDCMDVAKIARQGRVRIIFLNACDTVLCGQHAVDAGVHIAICYRVDIMDSSAWEVANVFYSTLALDNKAVEDAYQAAKPSDHTLIRLVGDGFMKELLHTT